MQRNMGIAKIDMFMAFKYYGASNKPTTSIFKLCEIWGSHYHID